MEEKKEHGGVETQLAGIGAKIAKATELSYSATKLLQDIQIAMVDLHAALGDTLEKP